MFYPRLILKNSKVSVNSRRFCETYNLEELHRGELPLFGELPFFGELPVVGELALVQFLVDAF